MSKFRLAKTIQPDLPPNGKIFIWADEIDGQLKQIDSTGLVLSLVDTSTQNGFISKTIYETIPATHCYPANMHGSIYKYAPTFKQDSYWFSNMTFAFINLTTGITTEDLTFTDFTEMETWVDTNIPNNGVDFTEQGYFVSYDIMDSTIPVVSKLKGLNSLFNSVVKGSYRSHSSHATINSTNEPFFKALFEKAHNITLPVGHIDERVIWMTRNSITYHAPLILTNNSKTRLDMTESYRYGYNTAWNTYNPVENIWEVTSLIYGIVSGHFTWYSLTDINDNGAAFRIYDDIITDGNRLIVAYGVQQVDNINNKAILLKPFTEDSFIINYPDFDTYSLEMVYKSVGRAERIISIKKFDDYSDIPTRQSDISTGRLKIRKADIYPYSFMQAGKYKKSVTSGYVKAPKVYFRYRRKSDGQVGSLSPSYINHSSHGMNIWDLEVRSFISN